MGGKKKGKGKKAKGDDDEEEKKSMAKAMEREVNVLQQQIGFLEEKTNKAKENEDKYRKEISDIKSKIDAERKEKDKISLGLMEDTKRMEDNLMRAILDTEAKVTANEQELKDKNAEIERLKSSTEEELAKKKAEIKKLKSDMELMSSEFMAMLKGTLEKMRSRIDTAGSTFERENEKAEIQKLEEYALKQVKGGGT